MGCSSSSSRVAWKSRHHDISLTRVDHLLGGEGKNRMTKGFETLVHERERGETLSKSAYVSLFEESLSYEGTSLFVFDRLFDAMNLSGTGRLTLEEYIKGMCVLTASNTAKEKYWFLFRLLDVDRDDQITLDEASRVFRAILSFVRSTMECGSGDVDISFALEVQHLCRESDTLIVQFFDFFDRDKDGVISESDWLSCARNPHPVVRAWIDLMEQGSGAVVASVFGPVSGGGWNVPSSPTSMCRTSSPTSATLAHTLAQAGAWDSHPARSQAVPSTDTSSINQECIIQ